MKKDKKGAKAPKRAAKKGLRGKPISDAPGPGPKTPEFKTMQPRAEKLRDAERKVVKAQAAVEKAANKVAPLLAAGKSESDPEMVPLVLKWKAAVKAHKEAKKVAKEAKEAGREELQKVLKPQKPAKVKIKSAHPTIRPQAEESINFLQNICSEAATPDELDCVFKKGKIEGRAKTVGKMVWLDTKDSAKVASHELGHVLEDNNPKVRKAARRFLKRRCAGEKPEQLQAMFPQAGFAADEKGRKDDFERFFNESDAWYVGKVYDDGSTEVISCGLEALHDDPAAFAYMDPDYFDLMVSVLKGKAGRKNKKTKKEPK